MLCYFIIHSIVISNLQVSSRKHSVIFKNFYNFLVFIIIIGNIFFFLLCDLFSINNSVIFKYITIFMWSILLFLHIHIFILLCFHLCPIFSFYHLNCIVVFLSGQYLAIYIYSMLLYHHIYLHHFQKHRHPLFLFESVYQSHLIQNFILQKATYFIYMY